MENLVPPSYESRIELLDHSWARREIGSIDRGERDLLQTARSSRVRHKVSWWRCSPAARQWRWPGVARQVRKTRCVAEVSIDGRGARQTSALGVGSTRKGGSEHSAVEGKCDAKTACRLRGKSQCLINNCLDARSSDTLPCWGLARSSCRNPLSRLVADKVTLTTRKKIVSCHTVYLKSFPRTNSKQLRPRTPDHKN